MAPARVALPQGALQRVATPAKSPRVPEGTQQRATPPQLGPARPSATRGHVIGALQSRDGLASVLRARRRSLLRGVRVRARCAVDRHAARLRASTAADLHRTQDTTLHDGVSRRAHPVQNFRLQPRLERLRVSSRNSYPDRLRTRPSAFLLHVCLCRSRLCGSGGVRVARG